MPEVLQTRKYESSNDIVIDQIEQPMQKTNNRNVKGDLKWNKTSKKKLIKQPLKDI